MVSTDDVPHTGTDTGADPKDRAAISALVAKYSAVADLAKGREIRVVWLHPDLVNQLLEKLKEHSTGDAIGQINSKESQIRRELTDTLSFFFIFNPTEKGMYISQPVGLQVNGEYKPAIWLLGTGSYLEYPTAWDQVLGEHELPSKWYTNITYGYVTFSARRADGTPVLAGNDFSVALSNGLQMPNGDLYNTKITFPFRRSTLPLASLVEPSIPAETKALVTCELISSQSQERHVHYAEDSESGNRMSQRDNNSLSNIKDLVDILSLVKTFIEFIK